jgi:proliferating cell nuclear antigen
MNVQFKSAGQITEVFNGIVDLLPIVKMVMTPGGISIKCIETNNISFIDLLIAKDDLKSYVVEHENSTITFDLKLLLKILGKMNRTSPFRLRHLHDSDKLKVSQLTKEYTLSLIDIDIQAIDVPDRENDVVVSVPSLKLKDTFETLLLFSETCRISALSTRKSLVVSSHGDFGSGREEYEADEDDKITTTFYEFFPLPYLVKFMKAMKVSSHVNICMNRGKPVSFQFDYDNSYLRFYLAPKVSDDTDVSQQGPEEDDVVDVPEETKGDDGSESEYEEVMVTDSDSDSEDDD